MLGHKMRHANISTHNRGLSHKAGLGLMINCFLHNDLWTAVFSGMSSISGDFVWLHRKESFGNGFL